MRACRFLLDRVIPLTVIAGLLVACSAPAGSPSTPTAVFIPPTETAVSLAVPTATSAPATPAAEAPTSIPTETSAAPTPVATPVATPVDTPLVGSGVEEAILILEPGPGSRVVTPLHLSGMADTTFEQTLGVRLVLDDGTELLQVPAMIQAELGQRGPFEVDLEFSVEGERQAFLQVFASSARDGGITHLASVGLILASQGPANIRPVQPHDERIRIDQPELNAEIQGGILHVEGFALASFEQNLMIELLGENGEVLASQPVTVTAPDMGIPGPFSADLSYPAGTSGAGRVVVRDPSPAFEGDLHAASVEIRFIPEA